MADVKDLSAYKGVWVFAEQREGKIMPVVIDRSERAASWLTQLDASCVPYFLVIKYRD